MGQVVFIPTAVFSTVVLSTAAALRPFKGVSGAIARTLGALSSGDGGGGDWYWDADDSSSTDNVGTVLGSGQGRWKRLYSGALNVRWFGAKGDGDETPMTVSSYRVIVDHTTQTHDGNAINQCIRANRARGGGGIYFPSGTYAVWGYLESIDCDRSQVVSAPALTPFPPYNLTLGIIRGNNVSIRGDGVDSTIIKNAAAAPTTAGFGILHIGDGENFQDRVTQVSIKDLTLDGNGYNRPYPFTEAYNAALKATGWARMYCENIKVVNSITDGLLLVLFTNLAGFPEPPNGGAASETRGTFINCEFGDSWRNSVSVITGANHKFTKCRIYRGGKVRNGTNPRACVDIEPDIHEWPVINCTFEDCSIEDGNNQLCNTTWSRAKWVNCDFRIMNPDNSIRWAFIAGSSEVDFINCNFYDDVQRAGNFWCYPHAGIYSGGFFGPTQYVNLEGCKFQGVGYYGQGKNQSLSSCKFINSRYPVFFEQYNPDGLGIIRSITVKNCSLVNVVDVNNYGSGPSSAFAVKTSVTPDRLIIDGLDVSFQPNTLPIDNTPWRNASQAYGVTISPTVLAGSVCQVSNVQVSGFYDTYPTTYGFATDPNAYRNWGVAGSYIDAPTDTTGPVTKGLIHFSNCTHDQNDYTNYSYSRVLTVRTAAILRGIKGNQYGVAGLTLGGAAEGDGAGRLYWWKSTDSTSVDNGTTILGSGTGRWLAIA